MVRLKPSLACLQPAVEQLLVEVTNSLDMRLTTCNKFIINKQLTTLISIILQQYWNLLFWMTLVEDKVEHLRSSARAPSNALKEAVQLLIHYFLEDGRCTTHFLHIPGSRYGPCIFHRQLWKQMIVLAL